MIYTLDSNVVIDAVRQPDSMVQLKAFLEWALPYTALTSVVVLELLRGARTHEARAFLEAQIIGPFARRRRIVAPSIAAWTRTGTLLGQLDVKPESISVQNDVLIACTARELGWVVITKDRDLFRLRTDISGLRVHAPFPER